MNERMDLSALELSEAESERLVAAIMSRSAHELSRRSADISPMLVLSDWARPALAAAAVVAVVCMSVLARAQPHVEPGSGLTDALEVPAPVNEWLISDRAPTVADLLIALEAEGQ
jgi:hypothetical protein